MSAWAEVAVVVFACQAGALKRMCGTGKPEPHLDDPALRSGPLHASQRHAPLERQFFSQRAGKELWLVPAVFLDRVLGGVGATSAGAELGLVGWGREGGGGTGRLGRRRR